MTKIRLPIIVLIMLIAGNALSDEIVITNPIECYDSFRHGRHGPSDSVLIGKIYFDPLPRYQKSSKVFVEYYCDFESDDGAFIQVAEHDKRVRIEPCEYYWSEPVNLGDTLKAEFDMTPLDVGNILVRFRMYEPEEFEFKGEKMTEIGRSLLIVPTTLGASGLTIGLGKVGTGSENSTFLGPIPEIMADSLLFFWDPKMNSELISFPGEKGTKFRYFAIESIVYTQPDDSGYLHVKCKVSPYHNFESGIKFNVGTGGNIDISNKTPNFGDPVLTQDTLEFHFDFKITAPGISRMTVGFRTENPETGFEGSGGKIGHGYEKLSNWITIYVGYDEEMNLIFITDKDPYRNTKGSTPTFDERVQKRLSVQRQIDPRIRWLEAQMEDQ